MQKLQKKDIKVLIVLIGVLVLLLSYLLVYRNFTTKREEVEGQIAALEPELQQLREYDQHKQEYVEGTAAYKENIQAILSVLPTQIWTEDQLNLASNIETDMNLKDKSVSFSAPTVVTQFQGVTLDNIDNYNSKVDMTANKYQMSINTEMDYTDMKDFIDYIYDQDQMTSLDSINLTWNAENQDLDTSVVINQYSLTWPEAAEESHDVPEVSKGHSDIFGSYGN